MSEENGSAFSWQHECVVLRHASDFISCALVKAKSSLALTQHRRSMVSDVDSNIEPMAHWAQKPNVTIDNKSVRRPARSAAEFLPREVVSFEKLPSNIPRVVDTIHPHVIATVEVLTSQKTKE
jgi:hypothetical protein